MSFFPELFLSPKIIVTFHFRTILDHQICIHIHTSLMYLSTQTETQNIENDQIKFYKKKSVKSQKKLLDLERFYCQSIESLFLSSSIKFGQTEVINIRLKTFKRHTSINLWHDQLLLNRFNNLWIQVLGYDAYFKVLMVCTLLS